jgi:quercetin dioxygenase-like cupin family protein
MKIPDSVFAITKWNELQQTEHPGETGMAYWRTVDLDNVRIRMVEYSPGYLADHWCDRGHILLVLEGELISELKDGRSFTLIAGTSYHVSDFGDAAHRSSTIGGAKLFIVD